MTDNREFHDGETVPGTQYKVVRLIGQGGMGSVYEVEHAELGKRFVLKVLLRDLSGRTDLTARLRNEWRALGKLEHPNIVSVSDAGTTTDGTPFFVMERLQGQTLAQVRRKKRRFELEEACRIARAILSGLAAAHAIGVVHRDIKPPNVFLLSDGGVKLLDFGIAKLSDSTQTLTGRGIAIGTPRYMSPEQAAGKAVDARADLYAVGLILYEMIAGFGPYGAKREEEIFRAHVHDTPEPLSQYAEVPAALETFIASLLEKKPEQRPDTAVEAAAILEELLQTTGIVPALSEPRRSSAPPPATTDSTEPAAPPTPSSRHPSSRTPISQQSTPAASFTQPTKLADEAHGSTSSGGTLPMTPAATGTTPDAATAPAIDPDSVGTRTSQLAVGKRAEADTEKDPPRSSDGGVTPPPVAGRPDVRGKSSRALTYLAVTAGAVVAAAVLIFALRTESIASDPSAAEGSSQVSPESPSDGQDTDGEDTDGEDTHGAAADEQSAQPEQRRSPDGGRGLSHLKPDLRSVPAPNPISAWPPATRAAPKEPRATRSTASSRATSGGAASPRTTFRTGSSSTSTTAPKRSRATTPKSSKLPPSGL